MKRVREGDRVQKKPRRRSSQTRSQKKNAAEKRRKKNSAALNANKGSNFGGDSRSREAGTRASKHDEIAREREREGEHEGERDEFAESSRV